jgi:uncharacterized protein YdeI (YjbR/CyaY-like superfamily)
MKPTFFSTPAKLRAWFERHHSTSTDLLVGLYKRSSGKPSISWPELVDEALCFGWIDGVRKGLNADSYSIRLTPRKRRSTWSAVNMARVEELSRVGRMRPEGLRAFERRTDERSAIYSYEQRKAARLDPEAERLFRANKKAWAFFLAQAHGYRTATTWWVMSAKREETRRRRLAALIRDSEDARRVGLLSRRTRAGRSE